MLLSNAVMSCRSTQIRCRRCALVKLMCHFPFACFRHCPILKFRINWFTVATAPIILFTIVSACPEGSKSSTLFSCAGVVCAAYNKPVFIRAVVAFFRVLQMLMWPSSTSQSCIFKLYAVFAYKYRAVPERWRCVSSVSTLSSSTS